MPEADPDDDEIVRYIVRHYRFDPNRHERRHVVVAAFDNEAEFRDLIDVLSAELRARKESGQADPREWLSGVVHVPGYRRMEQRERWNSRRRPAEN